MAKLTVLVAFVALIASGCEPQDKTIEIPGTTAERVAGVTRLIESSTTLPSKIQDARLLETKTGDNRLGPADYKSFIRIKVAPEDVAKWKATLKANTPPIYAATYYAPPTPPKWWLSKKTFDQFSKFDSQSMFQRHGWIAVGDDGNIFAMTFTM